MKESGPIGPDTVTIHTAVTFSQRVIQTPPERVATHVRL